MIYLSPKRLTVLVVTIAAVVGSLLWAARDHDEVALSKPAPVIVAAPVVIAAPEAAPEIAAPVAAPEIAAPVAAAPVPAARPPRRLRHPTHAGQTFSKNNPRKAKRDDAPASPERGLACLFGIRPCT